jgi:glutamine synthetase
MHTSLDERLFEIGVGFDSSSIPRFRNVHSGDMCARPDLSACFIDTTFDQPTLSSIADIVEADSGSENPIDPRSTLRRALDFMKSTGIADTFVCAPELEFYLFSEAGFQNGPYGSWFRLGAPGVGQPIGEESLGASERLVEGRGYMSTHPQDWWQNERATMAARIQDTGLPVRYHHLEVGAAGQQEIELGFSDAMVTADGILVGKYIVRDVAVEAGIEACFMPKPIADAAGSGLHIHFRLLKDGRNLFAGDGYGGLSETAKFFLGGILTHGRSILAAIRIPRYSTGKHARCEFRPGDAMMNPYLAIASLLMAGLDGIENKTDPTPLNFGPFDGQPPEIDMEKHPECFLPDDLADSLNSLEADHEFFARDDVFSESLIENYLSCKRQNELGPLARTPHPLEFEMYWGL